MERAVRTMRRAISPRLAIRRVRMGSKVGLGAVNGRPSHPEHAVAACAGGGLVVDDREAHPEDGAGVPWVDDAVVVEPTGEEERERLGFDLGLHQLPDRKSTRLNSSPL